MCGYMGELVSILDLSLLVKNQIRSQQDIEELFKCDIALLKDWILNFNLSANSNRVRIDLGLRDRCKSVGQNLWLFIYAVESLL